MTTPMQMGAEPRPQPEHTATRATAPRQQEAAAPSRDPAEGEAAPQQMGAPLLRDWASI